MKSLKELEKCFETDQAKSLMVFVDDVINRTVDHFAERIDQRFEHIDQRFDLQDKKIELLDKKIELLDKKVDVNTNALRGEISMLKWVVGVGMIMLFSLGIAGLA